LYLVGSLSTSVRASIVDVASNTIIANSVNTIPTSVLSTGGQRYYTWHFSNAVLSKDRYYGVGWSLTDNVGDASNYVRVSNIITSFHSYTDVTNGTTDTDTTSLFGTFLSNINLSTMTFRSDLFGNTIFYVAPLEQPQTVKPLNLGGGFTL
jgi:hypothetical protein